MEPAKKDHLLVHAEDADSKLEVEAQKAEVPEAVEEIDPVVERRVVRKQDMVILPLLSLAFMFAYLVSPPMLIFAPCSLYANFIHQDRGNIGNARVLGMQTEVGLSSQQYLNCVMMFYLGYMLIELPAGMALRYIHPRYCFGGALICFGVFATLLSIAGYEGIAVLRLLIGLAEVFVTNSFIFVSVWYRQSELAKRTGEFLLFWSRASAQSFSGLTDNFIYSRDLRHDSRRRSC